MNSTCPSCRTVYRIDPNKVPSGGVRARCVKCEAVFQVSREQAPANASAVPAPTPPEPAAPAVATPPVEPERSDEVAASANARSSPPPAFGVADPHSKARRLARALISDIVVYHPERREESLRNGTLRQEFREEIRKSWEEYVTQVGDSLARGTPYFREALNEILAGGAQVF
jgi:predicted Zn finger-like uncharacterized protein